MDDTAHWGIGKSRDPDLSFDLGTIRWSTAALAFLAKHCGEQTPREYGTQFVMRHALGDQGDAPWTDHNKTSIQTGKGIVISSFPLHDTTLLVLTAFKEKTTLVVMPEDTKDSTKLPNGMLDIHIETEDD